MEHKKCVSCGNAYLDKKEGTLSCTVKKEYVSLFGSCEEHERYEDDEA